MAPKMAGRREAVVGDATVPAIPVCCFQDEIHEDDGQGGLFFTAAFATLLIHLDSIVSNIVFLHIT